MHSAYEVAFKYEISNEIIASISGFISRNYHYPYNDAPKEIVDIDKEIDEIYQKLPLEKDYDKHVNYQNRLVELLKRVKEITPKPHK